MADTENEVPTIPPFEYVKDQIQFSGFSKPQQISILKDLERVYETDAGKAMIDNGLAGEGLHYLNTNS